MRDVVSIDPGHGGARFNCERGWVEGEIGDLHFGVRGKCRGGSEQDRQARERHDLRVQTSHGFGPGDACDLDQFASGVSVMARGLSPTRTATLVMPSMERS